eukprot:3561637-Pyramimonas_sp.AAC.1
MGLSPSGDLATPTPLPVTESSRPLPPPINLPRQPPAWPDRQIRRTAQRQFRYFCLGVSTSSR